MCSLLTPERLSVKYGSFPHLAPVRSSLFVHRNSKQIVAKKYILLCAAVTTASYQNIVLLKVFNIKFTNKRWYIRQLHLFSERGASKQKKKP